jgi:hypothetical protein
MKQLMLSREFAGTFLQVVPEDDGLSVSLFVEGDRMAWFDLTPKEASELGSALIAMAIECDMRAAAVAAALAQKPTFDGLPS